MKNQIKCILISLCAIGLIATQAISQTTTPKDFTGTWVLNLQKSELNDLPLFVAPKQVKITQDQDFLTFELVVISMADVDSTMRVKAPLKGQPVDILTADQRSRHYVATWLDNGKTLKQDYNSSYSGKPDKEEYHTTELWKLDPDRKRLTLEKEVNVIDVNSYSMTLVYDKK